MPQKKETTGEIWVKKFTEEAAEEFREQVICRAMKDPHVPILIYIDSYGGFVDSLAKMIDTLDQIPNPIVTCCMGKAMSCGAILLSHGQYRYCAPNSRTMIHEVSGGAGGDVHDALGTAEANKRLNTHFIDLLAKNCEVEGGGRGLRKMIKEHDGRNLWMDAQESLDFGLVDEIGFPQIVPYIRYEIATMQTPTRDQKVAYMQEILGE